MDEQCFVGVDVMIPAAAQSPLVVERLTDLSAVEALAGEWRELMRRSSSATPFQHPAWLLPWYQTFARDAVRLYAVRDNSGRLAAVLPGALADNVLVLAGGDISDYCTAVIDDGSTEQAVRALNHAIERDALACDFGDVPEDSRWAAVLLSQTEWTWKPSCVCPVVPLNHSGGAEAWERDLPAGLARNIRRYGSRLAEEAGARFETVAEAVASRNALDGLFRLHNRRWHERGGLGVLQSHLVRRFHDSSVAALIAEGLVRIHLLCARDEVIAAQYVLTFGSRAYSYIGGFDPGWARYGPGTLLMAYAIRFALAQGCREFDLLRGVEPYKYTWGAVNRTSLRLQRNGS